MVIKDLRDCVAHVAGDKSLLREILHPDKEDLDITYSLAHAVLKRGQASLPHKLAASEVYYILEGCGVMYIDDEKTEVTREQAVYIPPGAVQYIENSGISDLRFLCIVAPAWQKKDEEVL